MSTSHHNRIAGALSSIQQELGELLILAVQRGTSCHVQGTLEQVQPLLHRLKTELRSAGHVCHGIRLAGVTREELPRLLADQFGMGLPGHLPAWEVWQQLSDFLRGARQSDVQAPCVWFDLEVLDEEMLAACARVFHMSDGLGPHVFLTENAPRNGLKRLLHNLDLVELHFVSEGSVQEQSRSAADASLLVRPASGRPVPVL